MAEDVIAQVQRDYSRALARNIRAANRARDFLLSIQNLPLSPTEHAAMREYLRKETLAHDAYMRARRKLWTMFATKEKAGFREFRDIA